MKTSVIIGAGGLVGQALVRLHLKSSRDFVGTCYRRQKGPLRLLDITNFDQVSRLLNEVQPRVVFHCANLAGGVNFCQQRPEIAKRFHLDASIHLAKVCRDIQARLVFISTDYVFDNQDFLVKESHPTAPLNLYGKFKEEAEKEILKILAPDALILRTTNVYGFDPETVTPNYFMSCYRKLVKGEKVFVPKGLMATPTFVDDLATCALLGAEKGLGGIFHAVGSESFSRFEWAKEMAKFFTFDQHLVEQIPEQEWEVPRPTKLQLDNSTLINEHQFSFRDVKKGMQTILEQMEQKL